MSGGKRIRGQAGFTLVEVVIALAVFGLLMAALAGGLGFSLKASRAGARLTETTLAMARLDDLLHREIGRALRLRVDGRPHAPLAFAGRADGLRFPISSPSYPTEAGLYEVRFEIAALAGRETLLYTRLPYAEGPVADADDRARALLGDLAATIRFAYYDGKAWQDRWQDANALPRLVRLRISEPGSGALLWPDIVVRPEAEADAECPDPSKAAACAGGS